MQMIKEIDKMKRAREIFNTIIQGENPFTYEEIEESSFLHEPKMLRCLSYVSEILSRNIEKGSRDEAKAETVITQENMQQAVFPVGDIGLSEFTRVVNETLDLEKMKKLTVNKFTMIMKENGILGEKSAESGRRRTVCIEESAQYGFYMAKASYNGREYEKVMINEEGKNFLREHFADLFEESCHKNKEAI